MPITIRGVAFETRTPAILVRRQLLTALGSVPPVATDPYPLYYVCAAAVYLCVPEVAMYLDIKATGAMRDMVGFGYSVLDKLIAKGWDEADIVKAMFGEDGSPGLIEIIKAQTFPTAAEVEEAKGNSAATGS